MNYDGWMMADEDFGLADEMAYSPYNRYYDGYYDGYYDPRMFRFRRFHPRFRRHRRFNRYY